MYEALQFDRRPKQTWSSIYSASILFCQLKSGKKTDMSNL